MDVNSISPVYASLYTASSLTRAAAEAGQRQNAPVESPATHRAPSLPPAEDKGAALLLERAQYQASVNAQLGMALQQAQALEAGSGGVGTGPTAEPLSISQDGRSSSGPGLGPVNGPLDAPASARGLSGGEPTEGVERTPEVPAQVAETAALSSGTAAAPQPIADERVVLTPNGVSLSGLLDQVTRVFSGALGELMGDVLHAQGPMNPAQPNSRSNSLDRRMDLYRNVSSSLSRASRLDARERTV